MEKSITFQQMETVFGKTPLKFKILANWTEGPSAIRARPGGTPPTSIRGAHRPPAPAVPGMCRSGPLPWRAPRHPGAAQTGLCGYWTPRPPNVPPVFIPLPLHPDETAGPFQLPPHLPRDPGVPGPLSPTVCPSSGYSEALLQKSLMRTHCALPGVPRERTGEHNWQAPPAPPLAPEARAGPTRGPGGALHSRVHKARPSGWVTILG